MEYLLETLANLDMPQLIATGVMLWFFYTRLDKKIEKIENRISRLENDMIEVKTILRFKESCMLSNDHQTKKKAE